VGRLVYFATTSLDGYYEDAEGDFGWSAPDHEVHQFVNDAVRPAGTHLYGRRMWETMVYWATASTGDDVEPAEADFARVWQAADKVVYSSTLGEVTADRTRLERTFDPESVRRLVAEADRDVWIGGGGLAGEAIRAGLVDEYRQLVWPVMVGGGKHWLPDEVRIDLDLIEERRFANGVVHLHYRRR
jgi:dihydrofolate reductase